MGGLRSEWTGGGLNGRGRFECKTGGGLNARRGRFECKTGEV